MAQHIDYTFTLVHKQQSVDSTMIVLVIKSEHTHSLYGTHEENTFTLVIGVDSNTAIWSDGTVVPNWDGGAGHPHGWHEQFEAFIDSLS